MGHSAGGHEAAFLAYDRQLLLKAGAHPEWIVGLVGLSGPYALEPNSQVLNTIFASPYTEAEWQPVRFVTPQSPPALLVHGSADDVVSIKQPRSCATSCRQITFGSKRSSTRAKVTPIRWRDSLCQRAATRRFWSRA